LRLIRISDYIQRFELKLCYKFEKQHIVSDAFSYLTSTNVEENVSVEEKLNALFIAILIEIEEDFQQKIIKNYRKNLNWQKITQMLNTNNVNAKNNAKFSFYRQNSFIYRADNIIDEYIYQARRLYISASIISNVFAAAHDNNYLEYARYFDKIFVLYFVRELFKYLRVYLKHCSQYQIYQTRRYKLYKFLQSILILSISFHTFTIDFILTLLKLSKRYEIAISILYKFIKRVIFLAKKSTFSAF